MIKFNKILIAKEIIIFFSSALLIVTIWGYLFLSNKYNSNKIEAINNYLIKHNQELENSKELWVLKSDFDLLFCGWIPEDFYYTHAEPILYGPDDPNMYLPNYGAPVKLKKCESLRMYDSPDILPIQESQNIVEKNFKKLYFILNHAHYLNLNTFTSDVSTFDDFCSDISHSLKIIPADSDSINLYNHNIVKYYDFLIEQKYTNSKLIAFLFAFQDGKRPPNFSIWFRTFELEIQNKEIFNEIMGLKKRIYSENDQLEILCSASIILILIVYPLRFIIFIISWSIKTLKNNS